MNNCLSKDNIKRVRKYEQALKYLEKKDTVHFPITKMTSIKSLCKNEYHRNKYIQYLSCLAIENIKTSPLKNDLAEIDELIESVASIINKIDDIENNKDNICDILYKIKTFQNETRKIKWTTVRIIKSKDLLIIENVLLSLLSPTNIGLGYIYDATKNYIEKYNSSYGTGLIIDSAPMLEKIITFWKRYECSNL